MRLASRANREAVEALNAVIGNAVVTEATIDFEAVKSLTVLFGQLPFCPDKGTLVVMLVADLDVRGETAPVVAWVVQASDRSAERRLSRGATEVKVHQQFSAANPVYAVTVGVVVECLQDAPLQVTNSGCFLHFLPH